jgi:hypothetical protein
MGHVLTRRPVRLEQAPATNNTRAPIVVQFERRTEYLIGEFRVVS